MAPRPRLDPRHYRRGAPGGLPDQTLLLIPALAAASGAALLSCAPSPWSWLALPAVLIAPVLAWIDLDTQRLPDDYVAPLAALNLLALLAHSVNVADHTPILRGLLAAMVTSAVLIVAIMMGSGMGMGDVKLLAALTPITAAISWHTYWTHLTTAFTVNGLLALILLVLGKAHMRSRLPMGPGLLGSFVVVICLTK